MFPIEINFGLLFTLLSSLNFQISCARKVERIWNHKMVSAPLVFNVFQKRQYRFKRPLMPYSSQHGMQETRRYRSKDDSNKQIPIFYDIEAENLLEQRPLNLHAIEIWGKVIGINHSLHYSTKKPNRCIGSLIICGDPPNTRTSSLFLKSHQGSKAILYTDNEPTPPIIHHRIAVVADQDELSLEPSETGKWTSYLKEGTLSVQDNPYVKIKKIITLKWDEDIYTIKSGFSYSLRGLELSTLNLFNGELYSCDDKTGIVFQLHKDDKTKTVTPIPWTILPDGNATGNKGYKCEWGAVKNGNLYIGSNGLSLEKRTKNGVVRNVNNQFVKRVSPRGAVTHFDWRSNYEKMSDALNIHDPGYVVHEAVGWSHILKKWMFVPRKVSQVKYEPKVDEQQGSNVAMLADEDFDNIQVFHVDGELTPHLGFASFKWIPGTNDKIALALKTFENTERLLETYIIAFDMDGNIYLPQTKIADRKFEGIEFL